MRLLPLQQDKRKPPKRKILCEGSLFTCKDPNFDDAMQQDKTTKALLRPSICIVVKGLGYRVVDNQYV